MKKMEKDMVLMNIALVLNIIAFIGSLVVFYVVWFG